MSEIFENNTGNFAGKMTSEVKTDATIPNDKFFPDLSLATFKNNLRVDNTFDDAMLIGQIQTKIIIINQTLKQLKIDAIKNGYLELKEIPQLSYGDDKELIILYTTAVFASVRADLCKHFINYDFTKSKTGSTANKVEHLDDEYGFYDKQSKEAIAKMLGDTFVDCELI